MRDFGVPVSGTVTDEILHLDGMNAKSLTEPFYVVNFYISVVSLLNKTKGKRKPSERSNEIKV